MFGVYDSPKSSSRAFIMVPNSLGMFPVSLFASREDENVRSVAKENVVLEMATKGAKSRKKLQCLVFMTRLNPALSSLSGSQARKEFFPRADCCQNPGILCLRAFRSHLGWYQRERFCLAEC